MGAMYTGRTPSVVAVRWGAFIRVTAAAGMYVSFLRGMHDSSLPEFHVAFDSSSDCVVPLPPYITEFTCKCPYVESTRLALYEYSCVPLPFGLVIRTNPSGLAGAARNAPSQASLGT